MAKPSLSSALIGLGALAAVLSSCGLTDRYYVDESLGRGGSATTGGVMSGGSGSVGGTEPVGGTESSGGHPTSGGNPSEGSSGSVSGSVPSDAGGESGSGELGSSGAGMASGGAWEEGTGGSGSPDAGAAGAGGDAGIGCELGPFEDPEPVLGVSVDEGEWGPALSADARTLYFTVWNGDVTRLYSATRPDRGATFSAVTELPSFAESDSLPYPSWDGLTLYFVAPRRGATDKDIWFVTRKTLKDAFANPRPLPVVNGPKNDQRPWLSPDGLTLMFVSDRPNGAGTLDIWLSTRSSPSAQFSPPTNLTDINGASQDEGPALSSDGLTLYFVSNRGGSKDIYSATRAGLESAFGEATPLPNVNSEDDEVDVTLSADERELFYATNRGGNSRIWRATRDCL